MHNTDFTKNEFSEAYVVQSHCFPTFQQGCSQKQDNHSDSNFRRYGFGFENIENSGGIDKENEKNEQLITIEKEAYEKGLKRGTDEGFVSGQKTVEPLLKKLDKVLFELEEAQKQIYQMAEREAVELSIAIAKKIVGKELTVNKTLIINTIREALKKVDGHGKIKVKVNPQELGCVVEAKETIKYGFKSMDKIQFESDENVTLGGCVIQTNIGEIDARIEKQLEVIEEMLKVENLN